MILRLESIPDEGLDLDYQEGRLWFDRYLKRGEELPFGYHRSVVIHLHARRSPAGEIFLSGSISTEVEYTCSRCLERFLAPIDSQVDYAYLPISKEKLCEDPGFEGEGREEVSADTGYYDGVSVELSDLIAEQLLLDVAEYPLCQTDCRGLCPQCGVNRNREGCECRPTSWLNPFSVLKGFSVKKG